MFRLHIAGREHDIGLRNHPPQKFHVGRDAGSDDHAPLARRDYRAPLPFRAARALRSCGFDEDNGRAEIRKKRSATAHRLPVADFAKPHGEQDICHPSAEGHRRIAHAIAGGLRGIIERRSEGGPSPTPSGAEKAAERSPL
jgi:hypothetical protein